MDVRVLLERLAYVVSIGLVVLGAVVPGREVAIGAGMGLLATTVGTSRLPRKDDDK